MEPKLLSDQWLEFLGRLGRRTIQFDVPSKGVTSELDESHNVPFGKAIIRRVGSEVTIVSLAVGVHRAMSAAENLTERSVNSEVIDQRSLRPIDMDTVRASVRKTGRLVVVDEDYREFGLSGEIAASMLEAGLSPSIERVCVNDTLPYAMHWEAEALPNATRIAAAVLNLMSP
jgi:pyruvate dehydrogenase E1 component beta subunit